MSILKEGKDACSPSSYRPIALASCLSEVIEKTINRRLMYFLEYLGTLDSFQAGKIGREDPRMTIW